MSFPKNTAVSNFPFVLTRPSDGAPLACSPTGGTFTLRFSGQTTAILNHNAGAADVQAALEALPSIGAGNVTCSGGPFPETAILVEFQGTLERTDVTQIIVAAWLEGGLNALLQVTTVRPGDSGQNEIQSISIEGNPDDGYFLLGFATYSSGPISYNASASEVQSALEALQVISTGNVSCTGGPLPEIPVACEFIGALGRTNVDQLVPDNRLVGVNNPSVAVVTNQQGQPGVNERQQIELTTGSVTGYYMHGNGVSGTIAATPAYRGNFFWTVNLTAAEMNASLVGLLLAAPGARPAEFLIRTVAYNPDDGQRLGLTALPSASPGSNGGLPTVDASNRIAGITGVTFPAYFAALAITPGGVVRANDAAGAALATSTALAALQTHGDAAWATAAGFSTFNAAADAVILGASQPHYAPAKPGDAMTLTSAAENGVADAVLLRDAAHVEATAAEHSLCYVILAMSEANTTAHAGKLTVFRTDGTTEFVQKSVTTATAADAVTGVS
jgi:hypothetical protein